VACSCEHSNNLRVSQKAGNLLIIIAIISFLRKILLNGLRFLFSRWYITMSVWVAEGPTSCPCDLWLFHPILFYRFPVFVLLFHILFRFLFLSLPNPPCGLSCNISAIYGTILCLTEGERVCFRFYTHFQPPLWLQPCWSSSCNILIGAV